MAVNLSLYLFVSLSVCPSVHQNSNLIYSKWKFYFILLNSYSRQIYAGSIRIDGFTAWTMHLMMLGLNFGLNRPFCASIQCQEYNIDRIQWILFSVLGRRVQNIKFKGTVNVVLMGILFKDVPTNIGTSIHPKFSLKLFFCSFLANKRVIFTF